MEQAAVQEVPAIQGAPAVRVAVPIIQAVRAALVVREILRDTADPKVVIPEAKIINREIQKSKESDKTPDSLLSLHC